MSQSQSSLSKQHKLKNLILFAILAAIICIADQLSKQAVLSYFESTSDKLLVTSFFNIVKAYNTGASFGLLDGFEYSNQLFLILNTGVIIGLMIWMFYNINFINCISTAMIIGGAIGNLIDRVTQPGVIDFLEFHWKEQYYYPAFNIADSAIVIGVVILIIISFKEPKN